MHGEELQPIDFILEVMCCIIPSFIRPSFSASWCNPHPPIKDRSGCAGRLKYMYKLTP